VLPTAKSPDKLARELSSACAVNNAITNKLQFPHLYSDARTTIINGVVLDIKPPI